jgi:hypothetical protein
LPKATRSPREKITGTREVERAAKIREIDKGRAHVMNIGTQLQRVIPVQQRKNVLHLHALFTPIASA